MSSSKHTPSNAFLGILILLTLGVILVFTLSPFDFSGNAGHFKWQTNFRDVFSNVLLFLPLGFLLRLFWAERPFWLFLPEMAVGALLSSSIETTQLFLPDRHSQYSDILCNAAGAWLGAWLAHGLGKRLSPTGEEGPGPCASGPLYGVILLSPLLWLDTLAPPRHADPFLPVLFAALAGSLAIASVVACLSEETREASPTAAISFTVLWLLLVLGGFLRSHSTGVLSAILLFALLSFLGSFHLQKKKEKYPTSLRLILSMLLTLHLAVTFYAMGGGVVHWHWPSIGDSDSTLIEDHGARIVGELFAFLLAGYFAGTLRAQHEARQLFVAALVRSLLPLSLLVGLNGFLATSPLSLGLLPLFAIAFALGVALDHLRQNAVALPEPMGTTYLSRPGMTEREQ